MIVGSRFVGIFVGIVFSTSRRYQQLTKANTMPLTDTASALGTESFVAVMLASGPLAVLP
jgi:hypothetical protein